MVEYSMNNTMIEQIGKKEFRRILGTFPQKYNKSWEGNYKPIAMTISWIHYKTGIDVCSVEIVTAMFKSAMHSWEDGELLYRACKRSLETACAYEELQQSSGIIH